MKWLLHLSLLFFVIVSTAHGQVESNAIDSAEEDNVFVYEDPKGFGKVLNLVNLPQKTNRSISVREDFLPLKAWKLHQ